MVQTPKITRSIYYYKENDKYKPIYSHKYMKDFESTGKKSYVIYRKTRNSKDKPFYGRFYRKSEIKTKPNKKHTQKRKRSRSRRRVQRGGACAPCLIGPVAGALGVGTAGYLVSRRSSSSIVNGKQSLKRKEIYEMNKNGKKVRKTFIQDGLNLKLAGKKVKAKSMKKSIKRFNNAVKRCIKSGFKKC